MAGFQWKIAGTCGRGVLEAVWRSDKIRQSPAQSTRDVIEFYAWTHVPLDSFESFATHQSEMSALEIASRRSTSAVIFSNNQGLKSLLERRKEQIHSSYLTNSDQKWLPYYTFRYRWRGLGLATELKCGEAGSLRVDASGIQVKWPLQPTNCL
jgi:hypothetical protein